MNKFPSNCNKNLKDLILKLLNPHPKKRLGFQNHQDLLDHPYFKGCFDKDGRIRQNSLTQAAFKVERNFEYQLLTPIPYDLLFRIDDINGNEIVNFDVQGFTHFDQSISRKSPKI